MRETVQAGARLPEDIFDLHSREVREKHDAEDVYKGIEAEMAIRQYLDKDKGVELENRLRGRVKAIGASTPKQKKLVADFDSSEKKLTQWRIREDLKDDLKAYAKKADNTYSDVFALAIREYWTNSRLDRIEQLYDRVETAIEPWDDQIDGDGVNVSVVDRRTAEIAMELPNTGFNRSQLEDAIAEVTSDSKYNREKYTPLVKEHKGVELHPKSEKLFVPHDEAQQLREKLDIEEDDLFSRSFDALSSEDCVLRVQARGFKQALDSNGKTALKHSEIHREFDGEAGNTTIYNLMQRAAEADGFTYGEWHDTKKLRIVANDVEDRNVVSEANSLGSNNETPETAEVRGELDELAEADRAR